VKPTPYPEIYPPDDPDYRPTAVARTMLVDDVDAGTVLKRVEAGTAPMNVVQLRVLGGAAARVANDETAYAHRDRRMMLNVASLYEDPATVGEHETWVDETVDALQQGRVGAYVNFLGDEGPERVRDAYPPETYARLADVKRRYDPTNLFRLNQNVPPGAEDA
jgi:FAD/FMN-containing dehydrogenase